jgi:hypothetical protein
MKFSMPHLGAGAAIAPAVMLLAGLASCNNAGSGDGRLALTGSAFCTPFPKAGAATPTSNNQSGLAATPASTASDPGAAFDDCIHRWGYAMAPARDPADIVAHAAVDACGAQMNAWNQQAMAQAPQYQNPQYQEYQPPTRDRRGAEQMDQQQNPQTQALAQHLQIAQARSLFYVIQARAAGCAPPPANTLVSNPAT